MSRIDFYNMYKSLVQYIRFENNSKHFKFKICMEIDTPPILPDVILSKSIYGFGNFIPAMSLKKFEIQLYGFL